MDESELGWLKHLPEAGAIVQLCAQEKALLDERADLLTRLAEIERGLTRVRNEAREKARATWTAQEISSAHRADANEWPHFPDDRKVAGV